MDTKICEVCKKEFNKKPKNSYVRFKKMKYCSRACTFKGQRELLVSCGYKKGTPSWNAGKKDWMTPEHKEKIKNVGRDYILSETTEQRAKRTFKFRTMPRVPTMLGKKGATCPHWKGENATYSAKHRWIQCNWQKTGICELCNIPRPARKGTRLKWGTQWANKSGEYKRERTDWYELCPKCHKAFDNR